MSRKELKQELVWEMEGFQIKTNSLYKIVDKYDEAAPSGFETLGVTKLPSEGIGNTVQCRFISNPQNPKEGTWDTGLYEQSPRYATKDPEEVEQIVSRLKEKLIEPFKRFKGKDVTLDNSDDKFWNETSVFLYTGRVFNTSKIQDLFDLYIALSSYSLTPEGRYTEGSPKFNNSDYLVVDEHKTTEFKKDKDAELADAIMNFGMLLIQNKTKLLKLLSYIALTVNKNVSDKVLKATFVEYVKSNNTNAKIFNDRIEDLEDPKFEEKINIYSILADKYKNGTSVKRKENGRYYYNDTEIGEDLRQSAENITVSDSEEFVNIKKELFS